MIKKLALLGAVLAGAALLQNKNRRERLVSQVKGLVEKGRDKLAERDSRAHIPAVERTRTGAGSFSKPTSPAY